MKKFLIRGLILIIILSLPQLGTSMSYFSDIETTSGNTFTADCWATPSVPVLSYPTNPTYANAGSVWNLNPYMDWEDSTSDCPMATITYQYESYADSGLTNLRYQSGWLSDSMIPAPGTPEGTYYWHVRAKDQFGNMSVFSTTWLLIVDRTAPATPLLISPGNNTSLNSSNLIQTWQQVSDNLGGEVYYDYESYNDAGITSLRWTGTYSNSGNGDGLIITKHAEGAPNGHVYWRVKARDESGNVSSWSEVWHFLIDNSLPNPSPDGSSTSSSSVALNEILPNPLGEDLAPKPNGEWVELYNNSSSTVSVVGWHLADFDDNSVLITGTMTNTGGTDISGHGFLVIYTGPSSLTLDDGGDTVKLYNDSVIPLNLVDSHIYGSTPEGKSIARYPDGIGIWHDPIPTPGESNLLEIESNIEEPEDSEFLAELKDENISEEENSEPVNEGVVELQGTAVDPLEAEKQEDSNEELIIEEFQEESLDVSEDELIIEPEPEVSESQTEETEPQTEDETDV